MYLEYLECSYCRLPGKSSASVDKIASLHIPLQKSQMHAICWFRGNTRGGELINKQKIIVVVDIIEFLYFFLNFILVLKSLHFGLFFLVTVTSHLLGMTSVAILALADL